MVTGFYILWGFWIILQNFFSQIYEGSWYSRFSILLLNGVNIWVVQALKYFITLSLNITCNKKKLIVYSEIKKSKRLISSLQGRREKWKAKFTVIATKINRKEILNFHLQQIIVIWGCEMEPFKYNGLCNSFCKVHFSLSKGMKCSKG